MDAEREKMTAIDRIRDLETRIKRLESDDQPQTAKESGNRFGDGRVKLNPPAGA